MKVRSLSQLEQSFFNIIGSVIVVIINTLINFFLSPYIVKHLGVEVNGYITLANNFISYLAIMTTALNSMAGRYILIHLRREDIKEANEYYSSVFWGNWIMLGILLIPSIIFIANLGRFINIDSTQVNDIKILFALVFLNFFIGLGIPKWNCATYATNQLYLRSIKSMISSIARAFCIVMLFAFCKPVVYYVAVAGLIMTAISTAFEYRFKVTLLPQLRIKLKDCRFNKMKILISSGIWNTVSSCGNILLEGLDLLIANIFIDPVASGVLALAKVIPNMLNQIVGSITATFGPPLTYLYVDGKMSEIKKEVNRNIKLVAILANIPIGVTIVLGSNFFNLWVPQQDAKELAVLSTLTLMGILITGLSSCIINVFNVVNKLKTNSFVVIFAGLLNVCIVYILLSVTDLGVYAIAGVSSCISIMRVFIFTAPYAAHCINEKWYVFHMALIKGALNVVIPIGGGIVARRLIPTTTWFGFFVAVIVACIITFTVDYAVVLTKDESTNLLKALHIKR